MATHVLLIAPERAAAPVADALRRELDATVDTAPHRGSALVRLRQGDYTLVILEEALTAGDPETIEAVYAAAKAAPVLEANFAICSAARIVRQVRAALTRRAQDYASARSAATEDLRCELNGSLAGLLLESELALRAASPEQAPKLRLLVDLAGDLRDRLRA